MSEAAGIPHLPSENSGHLPCSSLHLPCSRDFAPAIRRFHTCHQNIPHLLLQNASSCMCIPDVHFSNEACLDASLHSAMIRGGSCIELVPMAVYPSPQLPAAFTNCGICVSGGPSALAVTITRLCYTLFCLCSGKHILRLPMWRSKGPQPIQAPKLKRTSTPEDVV